MLLVNPNPFLSRWGGGWDIKPGIKCFFLQDFPPQHRFFFLVGKVGEFPQNGSAGSGKGDSEELEVA